MSHIKFHKFQIILNKMIPILSCYTAMQGISIFRALLQGHLLRDLSSSSCDLTVPSIQLHTFNSSAWTLVHFSSCWSVAASLYSTLESRFPTHSVMCLSISASLRSKSFSPLVTRSSNLLTRASRWSTLARSHFSFILALTFANCSTSFYTATTNL